MPALPTSILSSLAIRAQPDNTADAIKVVCAWPVSGQYGPGSRILYYVLVAACVLARKTVWLRKACLAAALLLPAVAALHALVLCSMHINGVVDMDIYGAFQLCAIGILAAPLAVQSSKTYFYDPRRNVIFLWTGLILAGLLALAVEFYRVTPIDCSLNGAQFDYEKGDVQCNLRCSEDDGPKSTLRGGPNNNIGVIPVPNRLTFNAAMLLATACCIPAILALVFTFDKILDIHWKRNRIEPQQMDQLIEGANGATIRQMKGVNGVVRRLLSVIYVPLFGGAILTILGIGEANFFSRQVRSQTEPITSVGQWGPIAGTALAAIGSLYLLLTDKWDDDPETMILQQTQQRAEMERQPTLTIQPEMDEPPIQTSIDGYGTETLPRSSHESGLGITMSQGQTGPRRSSPTTDPGGRRKVAQMLQKAGDYLGAAAHNKYDQTAYNSSEAREFPEIPGEAHRNPELEELKRQYSRRREEALLQERSRASSPGSPAASGTSFVGVEGSASPPADGTPFTESTRGRTPARRDTLEVPTPPYFRP